MFAKRRQSACVALVGFCFSLLLVSISPVFADDANSYDYVLRGYASVRLEYNNFNVADMNHPSSDSSGSFVLPHAASGTEDYKSLLGIWTYPSHWTVSDSFYPDLLASCGWRTYGVVTGGCHMVCKVGFGYAGNASVYDEDDMRPFYFIGDRAYTNANACTATFVGTSVWASHNNRPAGLTDNTTGYCYRVDFDYSAVYGNDYSYDITGLGLWLDDFGQPIGSGDYACMLGYMYAWADTGDAAIDSKITDILTHVAKIDGNVQAIHSSLQSLLSVAKQIKIDTSDIVKLLQAINSSTALLQSDVAGIYDLLKNALVDESVALDNKSKDTAEKIMQQSDGEKYWMDKNTDNFNALEFDKFSFSNGVVGALSSVGSLFSSLWNALGDAVVVFTFPLMLGIALVLVGRISRQAQKSKGGKGNADSGSKGGGKK